MCIFLHLNIEFNSCARGVSGVTYFISIDEQLKYNRGCFFQDASHNYLELSFFLDNVFILADNDTIVIALQMFKALLWTSTFFANLRKICVRTNFQKQIHSILLKLANNVYVHIILDNFDVWQNSHRNSRLIALIC